MATSSKCHVCVFPGCSKKFSKPSRLRHHEMTHTGERPYDCEVEGCDKSYTRSSHLKRHMETAHSGSRTLTWDMWCNEQDCQAMFTSTEALNKHIRNHHKAPPKYKCPEEGCNEMFRKHHQLRAHRYHHLGVLPFQCAEPDCLKKFAQKSHLDRHKKVHEGYQCPTEGCSLKFPKFSQLRKHKKICPSTDALCPTCGKSFHSRSWLKQHMRTHSDTRTLYKCPHDGCPRAYLDVRNLNAHVRSYHDNKLYVCQYKDCSRAFSTKQKMKQHQKLHTETTLEQVPKKYPKKGHRKKDFLTRLTGISKSQLGTMEIDTDEESDTSTARDEMMSSDPEPTRGGDCFEHNKSVDGLVNSSEHQNTEGRLSDSSLRDKCTHSIPGNVCGVSSVRDMQTCVLDIQQQRLSELCHQTDNAYINTGQRCKDSVLHVRT